MSKVRSHGDGGLWLDKRKGLYRATVELGFDADGKRLTKEVTSKTKTGARKKIDDIRAEIAEHGAPLDKQVTVVAWGQKWLGLIREDVDPKTWTGYRGMVRNWITPAIGRKKVSALKPSDVHAMRTRMVDEGKSTSTQRQAHIVLSMMLDAAKADRLCRTNVAVDVRKPGARSKGAVVATRSAFTVAQAVAILKAASDLPNGEGARWWFKLLTGVRQGELLGARLADLNLDAGAYEVWWKLESIAREHGCGGTCGYKMAARCPKAQWRVPSDLKMIELQNQWCLTPPKSQPGRVVPLIEQLVTQLHIHLEATKDQPNPHGLIWHEADGSPITPTSDSQAWKDLLVTAGVIAPGEAVPGGTELTGHTARHTAVTVLASLGVDFQIIGEIIGHSSAQVTAIYRHAQAEERDAAMALLGGAFAQIEP